MEVIEGNFGGGTKGEDPVSLMEHFSTGAAALQDAGIDTSDVSALTIVNTEAGLVLIGSRNMDVPEAAYMMETVKISLLSGGGIGV